MKQDKSIKRFLSSRLFFFGCLVLLILVAIVLTREIISSRQIRKNVDELKAEITALEDQNQKLVGLIDYLQTDVFLEKEGRLKLGLRKSGESKIVITGQPLNNQEPAVSPQSESAVEPAKENNLSRWQQYFFGH